MKNLYHFTLVVFLFLLSCKKNNQQPTPTPTSKITLSTSITIAVDKTINDSTIILKWNKYVRDGFKGYNLMRASWSLQNGSYQLSKQTLIKSFTSADSLTYTEKNMPHSDRIQYYISAVADSSSFGSVTYIRPDVVVLQAQFSDMVIDKGQKTLYLINQTNGNISSFNYNTNTPLKTKSLNIVTGFSSLGTFGGASELYVPGYNGILYILDGVSLSVKDSISVSIYQVNSVVAVEGKLFVSWSSGQGSVVNTNAVKVYDRATKKLLGTQGYYNSTRLLYLGNSNNYEFVDITENQSPREIQYYQFSSSGLPLIQSTHRDLTAINSESTILQAFPDGSRFIVSSVGEVYTKNLTLENVLNRQSAYNDFAINNSGSVIYAAMTDSLQIKAISYPGQIIQKKFSTLLYPAKIFIDGNQLISVGKIPANTSALYPYIDIEKFSL